MTPPGHNRNDLLLDAAIAVAVLAGSIALLVVGENEHGGGDVSVGAVLLTALTSLPLVWVRRAPLTVPHADREVELTA